MKILVLYYSKTGNTKKLGLDIASGVEGVSGIDVIIKSTQEVTQDDFLSSDAIIAGSPVYFGTMAWQLKKVFDDYVGLRKQMEGKVGAAFATSGDVSGGKETTMLSIIEAMLINSMIIVGDPLSATGHYGTSCVGAPNEKDSQNAKALGKRVAQLVVQLKK